MDTNPKGSTVDEKQWLASKSPRDMLLFLRGRGDRKRRLFACACTRRCWKLLDDYHRTVIGIAESFADGHEDDLTRSAAAESIDSYEGDVTGALETPAQLAVYYAVQTDEEIEDVLDDPETEDCAILAARSAVEAMKNKKRETAHQVALLRDIFGNPFRPVRFLKKWRTTTAVGIARKMYDSHDFGAMPILADALQDGGCENIDILVHCRGDSPHVRGCWVVDGVLGHTAS